MHREKTFRSVLRGIALISACWVAMPCFAIPIVSVTGILDQTKNMSAVISICPCPPETQWALYSSWFTPSDFQNVSISADVVGSGTAYLTTAVGPGAIPSDLVATSSFSNSTLGDATLFTGLSLSNGTYYLVLTGPPVGPDGQTPDWAVSYSPSIATAAGVILGIDARSNLLAFDPSFPPDSPFHDDNLYGGFTGNYLFEVSGDSTAVPELEPWMMMSSGIVIVLLRRFRIN